MARRNMKWNKGNVYKLIKNNELISKSNTRRLVQLCKGRHTLPVKPRDFTVWNHPDEKTE